MHIWALTLSLVSRLIQYPMAPCKGRITVTKEDLACLDAGEFLNDVIIDFYLKSVCPLVLASFAFCFLYIPPLFPAP